MALPTTISSGNGIPGHNPPHVRETLATTYYFDASVSGPTDAQGVWTSPANGFNGATASQTYTTTTTSSINKLIGKGTNAPGTGNTITSVRCRVFHQGLYVSGTVTGSGRVNIRDSSDTEALGFVSRALDTNFGPGWSDYKTLTAPSGGWSWTEVQNLIVEFAPVSGGSWQYNVSKVEIEVIEDVREYYVVCRDGTGLEAFKSSDPSGTWTNVGITGGSLVNTECLSSVSDGENIHVARVNTDVSNNPSSISYSRFNMNTDTWDVNSIQIADISGMNAPDFSVLWCDIAYRSGAANELVVAACGLTDSDMGSTYQRVDLWHADVAVTTSGGWTGPSQYPTFTSSTHHYAPRLVVVANNDVEVFATRNTTSGTFDGVAHQSTGNTWQSNNTWQQTGDIEFGTHIVDSQKTLSLSGNLVYVNNGTTDYVIANQLVETTTPVNYTMNIRSINGLSADFDDHPTTVRPYIGTSYGPLTTVKVADDDVYFFFAEESSQDLYVRNSTDYGASFGSATEVLDAVTVNYISAAVLDSGKIAYLYDDGGSTKYNEYSLSTDPTGTLNATLGAVTLDGVGSVSISGSATPTLGADTLASSVSVDINADADNTLGELTLESAGGAPAALGTLNATLSNLTADGAGSVAIAGTFANTLEDLLLSASGAVDVAGTLSQTLGTLTLDSGVDLQVDGTLTATLEDLAASGTISLEISGDTSVTLADIALSAAGEVNDVIIGSSAITLADLTQSSAGSVDIAGQASNTLEELTLVSAASWDLAGDLDITLGELLLSASGSVDSSVVLGSLDATLASLTADSGASVDIGADTSVTLGELLLASAGGVEVSGTSAVTLGELTLASVGGPVASLTLNAELGELTLDSSASVIDGAVASFSGVLGELTLASAASNDIASTLDVSLSGLTVSSNGSVEISGTLSSGLGELAVSGTGSLAVAGDSSITLSDLSLVSEGGVLVQGTVDVTLDELTLSSTIQGTALSTLDVTLDPITLNSSVSLPSDASLNVTLDNVTLRSLIPEFVTRHKRINDYDS